MEYVIKLERPFEEIETLTRSALERHGFAVQRTFSLQSAAMAASGEEQPGYSVFLLSRPEADQRPLGLLALYRRGALTVIRPQLSLVADADVEAELIGALAVANVEICVDAAGSERCIDLKQIDEETRPTHD
jgi:hypothetical protein